jgi:hypothetical protein
VEQANRARFSVGVRQPETSIALGSRQRRIAVAQAGEQPDPGREAAGIWRISVEEQRSPGPHPPTTADRRVHDYQGPENRIADHNKSQRRNPIILLSACPRSGSNYLENLLSLHPLCRKSKVPEDFFLANSETLLNFCRSVTDSWDAWWLERLGGPSRLAMHIGTALLRFADPGPKEEEPVGDFRLVLRSPTTEGITTATTLFPDARVLVLVRDGPATVESGRRSFGWPYAVALAGRMKRPCWLGDNPSAASWPFWRVLMALAAS